MASEKIELLTQDSCRRSVPAFRPDSVPSDLRPCVLVESILVEIVTVLAVVSSEYIHESIVNDC